MKSEWNDYTLGDLVSIKYGKNQKKVQCEKSNIPIYGTGGLMGYATEALYDKPSVLIGRKGTIDKIRFVDYPFWTVDTLFYTIINEEKVIPRYLYYSLLTVDFLKMNEGTTIPSLRTETLNRLELSIPNKSTQEKIVDILYSLDKKIELNNLINKNLEQQAQAIFKNAIYENSEKLIKTTIGKICDVKGGKRLPKGINLITIPNSHPYIRVRDLNNTCILSLNNEFEYVDDKTQESISRYIVSEADILISIVGTIGLTALVHKTLDKANLTENCVKLTKFKNVTSEFLLLFLRSEIGQSEIIKGTVGAVQQKLPIKNIQAIAIDILPQKEMEKLDKVIKPIFSMIGTNIEENQRLCVIRDTLLPKLMNGEIEVSEVII